MKYLAIFILPIVISCTSGTKRLQPKSIIGKWSNTSLIVEMPTHRASDSSSTLTIRNEQEWEEALKIKPITTMYYEDGTFLSTYQNLENKTLGEEKGTWEIRNDSLFLTSNNYTSGYRVDLEGEQARFRTLLDWDQDGAHDDFYDGWQKRLE
ncbi:MAG: hypothetical protein KI790_20035 [Cyclobacteriaceae bacterium]|nr:hypothetical protein [Cyclobacteriaceae bacterium HetDA_MAG_MS6]